MFKPGMRIKVIKDTEYAYTKVGSTGTVLSVNKGSLWVKFEKLGSDYYVYSRDCVELTRDFISRKPKNKPEAENV